MYNKNSWGGGIVGHVGCCKSEVPVTYPKNGRCPKSSDRHLFVGAALWAAITYFTEYQIGWLAIGVGFLVGLGVSQLGKGIDNVFGIAGGGIALISVVLGNFLASIGFLAQAFEVSYVEMLLGFNYLMTFELMSETFSGIDLLFYGLAVYQAYRSSFRKVTRE